MTGAPRRASRTVPPPGLDCVFRAFLSALLLGATAGCGDAPDTAAQRGRGPLVSAYADITKCSKAFYQGPETALYSNRPYHTRERVDAAVGLAFCRGERHGTNVWIVSVTRPTDLVVFGHADLGLEDRGWEPAPDPVHVEAAGQVLDRVYRRRFPPGRYVVRQGFARTAPLVFWDDTAVTVAP